MDEREINNLVWRAFYLGARIALATRGEDLVADELPRIVGSLYPIASADMTLHDPTANAIGLDAPTACRVVSIGNKSIQADRDVAARVVNGFEAATEVKDTDEQA